MAADHAPVPLLTPEPEPAVSRQTWLIAALVIALAVGIAAVATRTRGGRGDAGAERAPDAYAASLPISGITLSEATNGAGGKATYVDGSIQNTGTRTLTAASVQVAFAPVDGTQPRRETVPLTLVRTREPYVDLEPVSANPLKPGDTREFRLIFEQVPDNWDVKAPAITVVYAK